MTNSRKFKHGHAIRVRTTKTYIVWKEMRQRCMNKNNKDYFRYGGRGITVCDSWNSYDYFLSDMGEAPNGLTIDRKDNDGPYAPWNCVWATRKTQQRNNANTTLLTSNGKTLCIVEWAEILGIPANRISARLYKGWTVERALK